MNGVRKKGNQNEILGRNQAYILIYQAAIITECITSSKEMEVNVGGKIIRGVREIMHPKVLSSH